MTALALPPAPRLRLVTPPSAASAQEVREEEALRARRALRVLRGGQDAAGQAVSEREYVGAAAGVVAAGAVTLPAHLRRPVTPATVRAARSVQYSPHHPAVRAAARARAVVVTQQGASSQRAEREHVAADAVAGAPRVSARAAVPQAAGLPVGVRRVIVLSVAAVLAALLVALGLVLTGVLNQPEAGDTVIVQAGQSLWDIAQATGSKDVAATVSDIAQLNHLEGSTIQAGQALVLPAQ